MNDTLKRRGFDFSKRLFDVVASSCALVVLAPAMLGVALAVRVKLGSPIIFSQPRPGRNERIFHIYKFRTMLNPDPDRQLTSDEDRLTPLGEKLRATSLDELPTLWNVLRGDMSIVGPRPLLVEYLERYSPEQTRRHQVRPGITGLAQVSGRNDLDWEDKFGLDLQYVHERCWSLDLRILTCTFPSVFRRTGIAHRTHVTMPRFTGTDA